MKDREPSSTAEPPFSALQFYSTHQNQQQHHHRFVQKRGDDEGWRDLPSRGADVNLLANSLTARLRRAARQKAIASHSAAKLALELQDDDAEEGEEKKIEKSSKKKTSQPAVTTTNTRPSILKRTVSNEVAEKYRYSPDESLKSSSLLSDHYLPNVFGSPRFSTSTGQLDQAGIRPENGRKSTGKNNSSVGHVSNGGGAGSLSRSYSTTSGCPVRLVRRAGIFLPADKYAQGRQTLHGEDIPFRHNVPVDYETVTIASRIGTPESDSVDGWSSGKSHKKKGLKVSWKSPDVSEDQPDQTELRTKDSASPVRLKSAGTVQSDSSSFSFGKPRFNSGNSRVPSIGVRWKVPVPNVKGGSIGGGGGGGNSAGGGGDEGGGGKTVHLNDITGQTSLRTDVSQHPNPKISGNRDPLHPWRALYPRDVHPVTTAMEREGTSVSKTMWHVPTRKVHAHTYMEDLLESRAHQWKPPMYFRMRANPVGASTPNQSLQVCYHDNPSSNETVLLSDGVENEQGDSCQSY